MKKLITIFLLASSTIGFAQGPVIEGTYYPVRNTSIKQVWDTAHGTLAIPATGPNQVWDYTFGNGQFTHIADTFRFKFLDPSTTPYAQYFPTATHAVYIRTPLQGNPSDSLYQYFLVDNAGLHSIGGFNIQHQFDSTIVYNPTEFYAPSEMPYLYTKIDTSRYTGYANDFSGFKGKIKGVKYKTFTYVGYGTLKLPNGTYNNVAQIREDNHIIDSTFIDIMNNNNYVFVGPPSTSTSKVYQFFRNNTFGSAYLMYLDANPANTSIDYGWYTLPVDFGSISGTVYTDATEANHITSGEAYLYRENSNFKKNDILAKATVDSNGNYNFDSIPYGEYRIAIRPDENLYPNALITYVGDTTSWMDATAIITTTTTSIGHKVHIKSHNPPTGTNNITGSLGSNPFIFRSAQTTQSNPIPGIGIVVKKNPGSTSAARSVITDTNGGFNLGNLDDGSYVIQVEIPGLHMAGTYSFNVANSAVVNGLDFVAGTDSIHPSNLTAGVHEIASTSKLSYMTAYPNPYSSVATIMLTLPSTESITLEVYNMLGAKIQTLDNNSQKQAGTYKYSFSAKNLNYSSGMYFVKLTAGNKTDVLKIMEQ